MYTSSLKYYSMYDVLMHFEAVYSSYKGARSGNQFVVQ